jgi:hypothetical protein
MTRAPGPSGPPKRTAQGSSEPGLGAQPGVPPQGYPPQGYPPQGYPPAQPSWPPPAQPRWPSQGQPAGDRPPGSPPPAQSGSRAASNGAACLGCGVVLLMALILVAGAALILSGQLDEIFVEISDKLASPPAHP